MRDAVGVIPARWGSSRFPGKILTPICGKPLLEWVVMRAREARSLKELLVATDDMQIEAFAKSIDVPVVMTRDDHPSGTDRIAEAVAGSSSRVVVNIQGDEPLVDPRLIDQVASVLQDHDWWQMSTAAVPMTEEEIDEPSAVKVVFAADQTALYFSRAPIPFMRDPDTQVSSRNPVYWRHVGLYGYRRTFLEKLVKAPPSDLEEVEKLEQLRALHLGAKIKVITAHQTGPGVDTPEDVPRAEQALIKAGLAEET
ncbi:MAG: 3-deoxy-manno-octulosonate cytidylyltransferase [Verrucomicrobiota bacterium]